MTVTLISVCHLSTPPLIPNAKCIAWEFNSCGGHGYVGIDLSAIRFEDGYIVPNIKSFVY
jgi:hypothetical protein